MSNHASGNARVGIQCDSITITGGLNLSALFGDDDQDDQDDD